MRRARRVRCSNPADRWCQRALVRTFWRVPSTWRSYLQQCPVDVNRIVERPQRCFERLAHRISLVNFMINLDGGRNSIEIDRKVPNPGDYFTFELDNDSLIVIRDDDGDVRALFNTCRHRGSRICVEMEGHAGKLVCPYHQWVYERDGKLAAAKWMGPEFDKSRFPLHRAHVQVLAGLIYVCLADEPPDFEPARQVIEPFIEPHGLDQAKICFSQEYSLRANWKLLVENNRECYHCPGGHPEFCQVNFDVGMPGDPRGSDEYQRTFQKMR